MAIIEAGGYRSPRGRDVRIATDASAAVAGTRLHLPAAELPVPVPLGSGALLTEVTNETSLAAARRLGADVACLVFASAKNPGGGFLNGAQAQEESIARASALYPCLSGVREFYDFHRRQGDLRYSEGHFDQVVFAVLDRQRGRANPRRFHDRPHPEGRAMSVPPTFIRFAGAPGTLAP